MKSDFKIKAAPYVFLSPFVLLTLAFFVYPFFSAVHLAFHQTNGPKSKIFVGLENFSYIFSDPSFYKAVYNTTIYTFFSLFLQLPLSLGLAMLLNAGQSKMKSFFRLVLYSPNLVGQIFVGILFGVLFVPRYGLFNQFMQSIFGWGLENRWLENPALVMPALVLTSLWMYVGYNMIYFLAALQNVDKSLQEAAEIDGASPWKSFLHVTVPSIKPVMTYIIVMSTIGSFQLFELPYALLDQTGGPNDSGLTIVMYMYQTAFSSGDLGTGSSIGWVLALIIFIFSMVQLKISGTLKSES